MIKMDKKTERNIAWGFITFGFVALLYLSYTLILFYTSPQEISANGVTITAQQYKAMNDQFKDDEGFVVCNFETKNCNLFLNIDKE